MNVQEIYDGSDGEATKALYARLVTLGPIGEIAVNLFRAQKASARAKVYTKRFSGDAYDKKNWSLANLCAALLIQAPAFGLTYGWGADDQTPGFPWVLYIDLPTGQVSFHARTRGNGPDYPGAWDGVRCVTADRIVRWCQQLLGDGAPAVPPIVATDQAPRWIWCRHCAAFWSNRFRCPVHQQAMPEIREPKPEVSDLRPGVRPEWDETEAR